jgi:hypothetical protein
MLVIPNVVRDLFDSAREAALFMAGLFCPAMNRRTSKPGSGLDPQIPLWMETG